MRSFQSFKSLGSNPSGSYRRRAASSSREGGGSQSGLVMDDKSNGRWLKLSKADHMDVGDPNMVDVVGGITAEEDDLEAQREGTASLKITVKRGFGTEH